MSADSSMAGMLAQKPTEVSRHSRLVGIGVTIGSSILSNACTIVATALLVRHLGTEAFGRVAFLTMAASAFSAVTASGLSLYLVRSISTANVSGSIATGENAAQLIASNLCGQLLSVIIGLILLSYGGFLQSELPFSGFVLAAIALPLLTADTLAKNRLIGHQKIVALAVATTVGTLLLISSYSVGAYLFGSNGYLVGYLLGVTAQYLCSLLACRNTIKSNPTRTSWPEIKGVLRSSAFTRFVVPATLAASLVPVAHWAVNLIAATKASRYSDVATLAVAMQFFNVVIFIPTVLNKVVLPWTIRRYHQTGGHDSKAHTLRQALRTLLVTSPAPLVAWLLADNIVAIYRFEDAQALQIVYCFLAAAMFASASIPISNYLVSHEKMGIGLVINIIWTAMYLTLSLVLPGGASAVGFGLMLAYVTSFGLALALLTRNEGRHADKA